MTGPEHNSAAHLLPNPLNKGPLSLSVSAALQSQCETTKKHWISKLSESPRKPHMNCIDPKLPSGSFLKLTVLMNKRQTVILTWLRTGHCPLNQYLKQITKSPTDKCAHCADTPETVIHYSSDAPSTPDSATSSKTRSAIVPSTSCTCSQQSMQPLTY